LRVASALLEMSAAADSCFGAAMAQMSSPEGEQYLTSAIVGDEARWPTDGPAAVASPRSMTSARWLLELAEAAVLASPAPLETQLEFSEAAEEVAVASPESNETRKLRSQASEAVVAQAAAELAVLGASAPLSIPTKVEEEDAPTPDVYVHCCHCNRRFKNAVRCAEHERDACVKRPLAAGRIVLVPRKVWPNEPCNEQGGRGWTAVVRHLKGTRATVRFLATKAADEHLHVEVLEPLPPSQVLSTTSVNDPPPPSEAPPADQGRRANIPPPAPEAPAEPSNRDKDRRAHQPPATLEAPAEPPHRDKGRRAHIPPPPPEAPAEPSHRGKNPRGPKPLTGTIADAGRRVLIPHQVWPDERCDEEGGRGWTAQVVKVFSGKRARVRFLRAHAEDQFLSTDVLEPLGSRQRTEK